MEESWESHVAPLMMGVGVGELQNSSGPSQEMAHSMQQDMHQDLHQDLHRDMTHDMSQDMHNDYFTSTNQVRLYIYIRSCLK